MSNFNRGKYFRHPCNTEFARGYHQTEFALAVARRLGIPIVHQKPRYMFGEHPDGRWENGILYLPDERKYSLPHEIAHWIEGRHRGALVDTNYGLDDRDASPKVDMTVEDVVRLIEQTLIVAAETSAERLAVLVDDWTPREFG